MMTSLDGVFAAGDIVRGASLVVWAIRDGRDVAARDAQVAEGEGEREEGGGMTMLLTVLALAITPQAAPAPPASAAARAADPASLAAAKRLIGMMKLEQTLDRMSSEPAPGFADSVIGVMATDLDTKTLIESVIARDANNRKLDKEILSQEFLSSIQRGYLVLLARASEQYAAAFTAQELTAIADFYSTGAGAKALALMPQLQASMSQAGQELGRTAGMEAGKRAFERIAEEMLPNNTDIKS